MANRRMFSKTVTSSSRFLMMSLTAQALYFHLGMNADDDGFCEHFSIMRMVEAKPDDLKVLQARGFVKVFDDKVLVILDWKENNFLRSDRYTASKYLEEYKEEIALLSGIPAVYQMDTQVRLGKDRLEIHGAAEPREYTEVKESEKPQKSAKYPHSKEVFGLWGKWPRNWMVNKSQLAAAENLFDERGLAEVKEALAFARKHESDPYCPSVTSPFDLDSKWDKLEVYNSKL